MKRSETLAALLVAAALSLPSIVLASGLPGSTDDARAVSQSMTRNQSIPAAHEERTNGARISSTDEARAAAGQQYSAPVKVVAPSACVETTAPGTAASTDEARAVYGRRLVESCAQSA